MLKTALKIELKKIEVNPPKNRQIFMEKEKLQSLWGENFKDFAIFLTVFELWQFYCYGNFIDSILDVVK